MDLIFGGVPLLDRISAQSHFRWMKFDIYCFFFRPFDSIDSDLANLDSEKVVFWGRGRFVFHIFHPEKVSKNEKCLFFLKV